jgi:hypothetical protein
VFTNELMTGWANSGTLPLSRVTIGSLQDIGYAVNYAAADLFTPSASGLAAGRQTSGTSSAALRGLLAASNTTTSTGVSTNAGLIATNFPVRSHASHVQPGSYIEAIDWDMADTALAEAGQRSSSHNSATSGTSTDTSSSDETHEGHCSFDEAWDSLAANMNFWAELAHA